MKVISFTGAQGTGKTYSMKYLYDKIIADGGSAYMGYNVDGYHVKSDNKSISRRIRDMGFPINEETTYETQYLIMLHYLKADIETRKLADNMGCEYLIYDRSPLDHLPYSTLALDSKMKDMMKITLNHMKMYHLDHCFYLSPLKTIEHEGEYRSIDIEFQKKVDHEFQNMLNMEIFKDLVDNNSLHMIREVKDLKKRAEIPYEVIFKD